MPNSILRTIEFKLYPTVTQKETLNRWLGSCCWLYNQALEMRIKAYRRRGESVSRYDQQKWLVGLRQRIPNIAGLPSTFARGALYRIDRAFQAFFRRCKEGANKPGFPRFRARRRYQSLEYLEPGMYILPGSVRVPCLDKIKARGRFDLPGTQKLLRIVHRVSGWYAQIVLDQDKCPAPIEPQTAVGIDVGLESFATLSTGEKIANPRLLRRSEQHLNRLQRRVSRCQRQSRNRRKRVTQLARQHERITAQRKDFAHQESRKLVNRFDFLAFEKLNIKGMVHSNLAKSIFDAAWGLFLFCVTYKAAYAGKATDAGNPCGTSQECPDCGAIKAKSLSERIHACNCGCILDRDEAAARVILACAWGGSSRVNTAEELASTTGPPRRQASPMKQEVHI